MGRSFEEYSEECKLKKEVKKEVGDVKKEVGDVKKEMKKRGWRCEKRGWRCEKRDCRAEKRYGKNTGVAEQKEMIFLSCKGLCQKIKLLT